LICKKGYSLMVRLGVHWIAGAVLIVIVLGAIQAAERGPYQQDQSALLEGVGEIRIDSGAVPGPLCVVGDKAFPVVLGKSGSSFQPVVAAGQWGAGRVIAFGHTAAFWTEKALSHAETRRFLANCLFWAGRNATPLNVAVYRMPNLASFLRNDEELRRHQIRIMDWSQLNPAFFPQTHVLIVNSHDLSPAAGSLVSDFVRGGGGLLVGGLGWGWLQLNPGKSLQR
jgi:hypothetical protein